MQSALRLEFSRTILYASLHQALVMVCEASSFRRSSRLFTMLDVKEAMVVFIIVILLSSTGIIDRWFPRHVAMDDPVLVDEIRQRIVPPSTAPYRLQRPDHPAWGQMYQLMAIQALTRNKTGGVFIESGAHDGESMSNSLLLERQFGWSGLLVEPSEQLYPRLLQRGRKAHSLQACLSQTGQPFTAMFRSQLKYGMSTVEDGMSAQRISDILRDQGAAIKERYPVPCYPLYSILLAANRTTNVDFFSLDIEGMEMGVLAYVPWERVDIQIVLVETHVGHFWNPQHDQIRWLLQHHGYLAFRLKHDMLFVKRDSPYAEDADRILREVRDKIAELADEGMTGEAFNDGLLVNLDEE